MEISEKWIGPYSSKHKILLVGEGNFSFSLCLASAFGSAMNITATSLDSEDELCVKYMDAMDNIGILKRFGCDIQHEVDVNKMSFDNSLSLQRYDRIVFNFPHAGSRFFGREFLSRAIEGHKELVRGFLENAEEMLKDDGEIHITHKTTYPFSDWGIKKLANGEGLRLAKKSKFELSQYPGYINKRGSGGRRSNDYFPVGDAWKLWELLINRRCKRHGPTRADKYIPSGQEPLYRDPFKLFKPGQNIFIGSTWLAKRLYSRSKFLTCTTKYLNSRALKPSEHVDSLFGQIMSTCLPTETNIDAKKMCPKFQAIRTNLVKLRSEAEGYSEQHFSTILGSLEDPLHHLDLYPYYTNYLKLSQVEFDLLTQHTSHVPTKIAFIGSGSMPLTSVVLAKFHLPNTTFHNIDIDPQANSLASCLVSRDPDLSNRMIFHTTDILDATEILSDYDVVFLASLVGVDKEAKVKVIEHLENHMSPQALLMLRSARGLN